MTDSNCPKCGYQRTPSDQQVMIGICPACGIAIEKYHQTQRSDSESAGKGRSVELSQTLPLRQRLWKLITVLPETNDMPMLMGRAALYLMFFIWGWLFILGGVDWQGIGGSFLHNVNLPFHEFGHLFFSPFGRFMGILGGSLFQVLMPLGLMLVFVLQRRDPFAGSVMLWWSGQNFIDVSPYIADAEFRAIPLIRGLGESAHDWGNLLTMTGSVDQAMAYARWSFSIGVLLILLSFCWGGYLLYLQKLKLGLTTGIS